MMHVQTATILDYPKGRSALALREGAPLPADVAARTLLLASLTGARLTDISIADEILRAVTDIYAVQDRRTFLPSSLPTHCHILVEGWAFRAQIVPDGARQITDIIAPGDGLSCAEGEEQPARDIEACGPARVAVVNAALLSERFRLLVNQRQRRQQDTAVRRLRDRLVCLGRRDARARLAYLMVETHDRLARMGLAEQGRFAFPFTQEHLADMLGLTPVHINRVLARLRDEDMLVIRQRLVIIPNLPGLCRIGGFEETGSSRGNSENSHERL